MTQGAEAFSSKSGLLRTLVPHLAVVSTFNCVRTYQLLRLRYVDFHPGQWVGVLRGSVTPTQLAGCGTAQQNWYPIYFRTRHGALPSWLAARNIADVPYPEHSPSGSGKLGDAHYLAAFVP